MNNVDMETPVTLQFNSGHADICAHCMADLTKMKTSRHSYRDMRCTGECYAYIPSVNSYEEYIRSRAHELIQYKKNHPIKAFLQSDATKKAITAGFFLVGLFRLFSGQSGRSTPPPKFSSHDSNDRTTSMFV